MHYLPKEPVAKRYMTHPSSHEFAHIMDGGRILFFKENGSSAEENPEIKFPSQGVAVIALKQMGFYEVDELGHRVNS